MTQRSPSCCEHTPSHTEALINPKCSTLPAGPWLCPDLGVTMVTVAYGSKGIWVQREVVWGGHRDRLHSRTRMLGAETVTSCKYHATLWRLKQYTIQYNAKYSQYCRFKAIPNFQIEVLHLLKRQIPAHKGQKNAKVNMLIFRGIYIWMPSKIID